MFHTRIQPYPSVVSNQADLSQVSRYNICVFRLFIAHSLGFQSQKWTFFAYVLKLFRPKAAYIIYRYVAIFLVGISCRYTLR